MDTKEAEMLTGKLNFYNSAVFGHLGRAALRPLYRRANLGTAGERPLSRDLAAALESLLYTIQHAPPRTIPIGINDVLKPVLYADAFFELEGARLRAHHLSGIQQKDLWKLPASRNGWGFVAILPNGTAWFSHGSIPRWFLERLTRKKTYIFLIEVVAQCLGLWFCAPILGDAYWSFCDNMGARYSLAKGYTAEATANAFVSLFWHAAAEFATAPWFEHVPSDAQLADGVSRGDLSLAKTHGWTHMPLEIDDLWSMVLDIIESGGIAQREHVRRLLELVKRERSKLPPFVSGSKWRRSSVV
jgi:hypothetical protein